MKRIVQARHATVELQSASTRKVYEFVLSVMIDVEGNAKARLATNRNVTLGEVEVTRIRDGAATDMQ